MRRGRLGGELIVDPSLDELAQLEPVAVHQLAPVKAFTRWRGLGFSSGGSPFALRSIS